MWYHSVQTINIFNVHIQVWGLMLAIGVILGWFLFDYNLLWRRIKHDSSWVMSGFVISALIGARVFQIFLDWDYYSKNLIKVFAIWEGGMASFGAYFFGFAFLFWYIKKYVKEKTDFLEATLGSMFLGLSIARMGCLMINDHIGKISSMPWAINIWGELRHPISLYYVIMNLVLFLFFSYAYYQKMFRGYLFWLAIGSYGLLRLVVDLCYKDWQGNYQSFYGTIVACLLFIIVGFVQVWLISRRSRKI